MHGRQEPRVTILLYDTVDPALVNLNVLLRGDRHEGVRRERGRVNLRAQLPIAPAIVMFRGGQAKGIEGLGTREKLVAQTTFNSIVHFGRRPAKTYCPC